MGNDDEDHRKGHDGVPDLRVHHLFDGGQNRRQRLTPDERPDPDIVQERKGLGEHWRLKGKEQRDTACRDRCAEDDNRPEHDFLASVELARRRVRALREQPPALQHPAQVNQAGNVVPDPEQEHQNQRKHESPGDIVVDPFADDGDRGERFFTQIRQDPVLAIEKIETAEREQDERARKDPMCKPLHAAKPLDHQPGHTAFDANAAAQQVEQQKKSDDDQHRVAAIDLQRPAFLAPFQPAHPGILHQHGRVLVRDRNRHALARPNFTPDCRGRIRTLIAQDSLRLDRVLGTDHIAFTCGARRIRSIRLRRGGRPDGPARGCRRLGVDRAVGRSDRRLRRSLAHHQGKLDRGTGKSQQR